MSWAKRLGVIKVRSNYWSDGHRHILYYCAKSIIRQFPFVMEINELVNEAWLHYMRYREETQPIDIKRCKSIMFRYVKSHLEHGEASLDSLIAEMKVARFNEDCSGETPELAVEEFDNFQELYDYCFNFAPAVKHYREIFELKFKDLKSDRRISKEVGMARETVAAELQGLMTEIGKAG